MSLQVIAAPAINISIIGTTMGALLALVLAARTRAWAWFAAILLVAIINALTVDFAFTGASRNWRLLAA
jgi:hypothetical protein